MERTFEKLNRETLECISYERSKWWSNLMNEYKNKKNKDNEEIDLEDIEKNYNDDGDEMESSTYENMAKEAESLDSDEDPLNVVNVNASLIPQNITQSNARGILAQIDKKANETGIIDNELREVLEQTLPIVEEYKRNWREAGFERILNTFDIKKIEEKVGGWLRRNNSFLNKSISPLAEKSFSQCWHEKPYCPYKKEINDGSDSDSLHSIDTARYIRSSRKHLGVQKRVSTTTTTIKSYCLIERKRNELRRKYEYLASDDTMKMFNPERCSRNTANYRMWPECRNDHCGSNKNSLAIESRRIRKRRFHHHRHCEDSYSSYSTSDEEDTREQRFYRSVRNARDRFNHKTSKLFIKSSQDQCYSSNEEHDSFLPYVHESECTCRRANKLCSNVRHVVNSSSEEWLVENCLAPEMSQKLNESLPRQKTKRPIAHKCSFVEETKQQKTDTSTFTKTENTQNKKSTKLSSNENEKSCSVTKPRDNYKRKSSKEESDDTINREDSFEYQLQQAIKLSKEQYKKDKEMKKVSQSQGKQSDTKKRSIQKKDKNEVKPKGNESSYSVSSKSECEISEESHTSSKLASQFSAELRIGNVEKSDGKSSTKTEPKLFGDMNQEKNVNSLNKRKKQSLDLDGSLKTRKSNKKLEMDLFSTSGKHAKNVRKSAKKAHENSSMQSCKLPTTVSESGQLVLKTFDSSPTSFTSMESNIEMFDTYSNVQTKKSGQKTRKRYMSPSSDSSNASSETKERPHVRKRLASKKPTLNAIKENVLEENNINESEREEELRNDAKKILPASINENTTFFGNAVNICNSTALNNNSTATSRQILKNNVISAVPSSTKKTIKSPKPTDSNTKHKRTKLKRPNVMDINSSSEGEEIFISKVTQLQRDQQPDNSSQKIQGCSSREVNDCTVVSSTTDTDFQVTVVPNAGKKPIQQPDKRYILYTPQNISLAPDHSIVNGRFKITEDHLASVIGKEAAFKFMKYYVGPREFRLSSTVYYRPPKSEVEDVSSDSDMDFLDLCSRYGELHESKS